MSHTFTTEPTESRVKQTIVSKVQDAVNDGIILGIKEMQMAISEYFRIKKEEGLNDFAGKEEMEVFLSGYIENREKQIESQKFEYRS